MANFSEILRLELTKRALEYANSNNMSIYGKHPDADIFSKVEDNFLDASYKEILKQADGINVPQKWIDRLKKDHAQVKGQKEMQSSNSSDALLMNIFCHPKISAWKGISDLLKITSLNNIKFGYNPNILVDDHPEKTLTEVDLLINDEIICEAKLTESNFTSKDKIWVSKYELFSDIFEAECLSQNEKKTEYLNYQLIRNIIAAAKGIKRFILFCDMRRSDLIKAFHHTVCCIKDMEFRNRCEFITWQELSKKAGEDLQSFLKLKYGIE